MPLLSRAAHLSPISRSAAADVFAPKRRLIFQGVAAWWHRLPITVVYRRPSARRCAVYIKFNRRRSTLHCRKKQTVSLLGLVPIQQLFKT